MIEEIIKNKISVNSEDFTIEYANNLLCRLTTFLESTNIPKEKNIEYYALLKTATTDVAFACELYLKSILSKMGIDWEYWKNIKNGHSLSTIFAKLPIETQKEVSKLSHIPISSLTNELSRISNDNAFIESRYSYEKNSGNPNYEFLCKVCLALSQIVNNKKNEYNISMLSNMSSQEFSQIDKENWKKDIIKCQTDYLYKKAEISQRIEYDLTEEEKYIRRNMTTCDLALYTELRFKYFNDKRQTHEYSKLYNKMSKAFKFLLSKISYVSYSINYEGKMNFEVALESLLFPENFESTYKADLRMIMSTIEDAFEKSRFCTTEYYDQSNNIIRFSKIIEQITELIIADEEKINRVYAKKEALMRFGEEHLLYMNFTVDDYEKINVDHFRELLGFITYSGSLNKHLLFLDDETHNILVSFLKKEYFFDLKDVSMYLNEKTIREIEKHGYPAIYVLKLLKKASKNIDVNKIDFAEAIKLYNQPELKDYPLFVANCIINNEYNLDDIKSKITHIEEKLQLVMATNENNDFINYFINNSYGLIKDSIDINKAISIYKFIYKVSNITINVEKHKELFKQDFETILARYRYATKIFSDSKYSESFIRFLTYANINLIDKFINNGYFFEYPNLIDIDFLCNENAMNNALNYLKNNRSSFSNIVNPKIFFFTADANTIRAIVTTENPNLLVEARSIYTKSPETIQEISELVNLYKIKNVQAFTSNYDKERITALISYLQSKGLDILISEDILINNNQEGIKEFIENTIIGKVNELPSELVNRILPSINVILRNSTYGPFYYESTLEICNLEIVKEHPETLELYSISTSDFYKLNLYNTLYHKIKSGTLTDEENKPFSITEDKKNQLISYLVKNMTCYELLRNVPDLLKNKKVVEYMNENIFRAGQLEKLKNVLTTLKNSSPIFSDKEVPRFTERCLELSDSNYDLIIQHFKNIYSIYKSTKDDYAQEVLIEYVNYVLDNFITDEFIIKKEEDLGYLSATSDKIRYLSSELNEIKLEKEANRPFYGAVEVYEPSTFHRTTEEDIRTGDKIASLINTIMRKAEEGYAITSEEIQRYLEDNKTYHRATEILSGVKLFIFSYYSEKKLKFDYELLNKSDEIRSKFL